MIWVIIYDSSFQVQHLCIFYSTYTTVKIICPGDETIFRMNRFFDLYYNQHLWFLSLNDVSSISFNILFHHWICHFDHLSHFTLFLAKMSLCSSAYNVNIHVNWNKYLRHKLKVSSIWYKLYHVDGSFGFIWIDIISARRLVHHYEEILY